MNAGKTARRNCVKRRGIVKRLADAQRENLLKLKGVGMRQKRAHTYREHLAQ